MALPRILFVGTFPPHPGGSGVVNGYLLKGLHDLGYPLSLVTPSSPETAGRAELVRHVYPGTALAEVPATHAVTTPWATRWDDPARLAQVSRMQEICVREADRFDPEIIFVGREIYLESVLPWAVPRNLSVIGRVPAGALLLDDVHGVEALQYALDLLSKADAVIVPGYHVEAGMRKHGLGNVVTIQNPVDLVRFRPAPVDHELAARLDLGTDRVVVAHASNLKPVKRIQDIVAAAQAAVARDRRLIFLIIGDGQDRAALEQAVHVSGLKEHFRFTGWVGHDRVDAHLRLAHMALMPSATEGLAAAYLEAMATGLPLLASDIAGAREVVDHGKNGFLFPVGDAAAISDLIVALAADPDLRLRVGANARAYVERNHQLDSAIDLLRRVVTGLVRRGSTVAAQ